mmetsp:Transcript_37688/g.69686  ORF Transcript_37688/g.69686 Transcript_37688/m.69686 type:complete len:245 (+) Transcript_37688:96-830(+)
MRIVVFVLAFLSCAGHVHKAQHAADIAPEHPGGALKDFAMLLLAFSPGASQQSVGAGLGSPRVPKRRGDVFASTVSADTVASAKAALVSLCESTPDNGVGVSEERLAEIEASIAELEQGCPPKPARRELSGIYDLLFCTAKGGSNGKVGPFVGEVTQTFVDDTKFINAVELFGGAVRIALYAEREVIADDRIKVTFKETGGSLFGKELFRKEINGSGVWKQRYNDGDLRVMNTPSIFVLRKRQT